MLLKLKPLQQRVQSPFYGSGGGILQFCADSKLGSLVIRPELGCYKRVSERNLPALRQEYFPPDAHHFVRRRGIPIHPGDLQVVLLGRADFYRDYVPPARLNEVRDVEFKGAVGPGNVGLVGDLFSIDPQIRAIVNSQEIQPGLLILEVSRQIEFCPIPPGTTERASHRHVVIGKKLFVGGKGSRIVLKILRPKRIRIGLIGDERTDHSSGRICTMPSL